MAYGEFKINGKEIKNPSTFKAEWYNVTTLERTADGDIQGDFIAKKEKFYFTYEAIEMEDVEAIMNIITTEELFMDLEYNDFGTSRTANVYVGSIPRELHYSTTGGTRQVWKNFTFNLIER